MDSEDRKKINNQIDLLKRQDSRLKNTIKGQMQIVRANAELLNETIQNVQENEKNTFKPDLATSIPTPTDD